MIVFGSPSRYIQGAGVLSRLGQEVATYGDAAALVVDPIVLERYGAQMADSCAQAGVRVALAGASSMNVSVMCLAGSSWKGRHARLYDDPKSTSYQA